MSLHGTMRYNLGLVGISVIMGLAITGMHYTGMDALHVYADGSGTVISGEPPNSLLLPLLLGASVVTFLLIRCLLGPLRQ